MATNITCEGCRKILGIVESNFEKVIGYRCPNCPTVLSEEERNNRIIKWGQDTAKDIETAIKWKKQQQLEKASNV